MDKKVSVIIPTYKRADFLPRAINSVLNQTYKNVEIIIVDDNGNQSEYQSKTQAMIEELYGEAENIIYIKNDENIGGANSRNKGVGVSSGDYLCFLDDDDIYLPNKIETQLKYMVDNNLEMSFTDIKMHNENDKVVDARDHSRYIKSLSNKDLLKYHLMYHLTPTDSYMFLKSSFLKTEGFKQRPVSQEFMLMLNAIEQGLRIGYLKGATAIQYIHDQGRVSSASGRIKGDKALYEIKKGYFHHLSGAQKRYIDFRYNAVFSIYYFRNKDYSKGLGHLLTAFFISPIYFIKEGVSMVLRVKNA